MQNGDTFTVGKIPGGSTIIRRATADDFKVDGSRVVLYCDKDGYHYWLCWGDRTVPASLED